MNSESLSTGPSSAQHGEHMIAENDNENPFLISSSLKLMDEAEIANSPFPPPTTGDSTPSDTKSGLDDQKAKVKRSPSPSSLCRETKKTRTSNQLEERTTVIESPDTPLPPTIFGERVIPDIYRQVADFIYATLAESPEVRRIENSLESLDLDLTNSSSPTISVEIEAKLGRLIDQRTGKRIHLPIFCETVIHLPDARFEANMSMSQHARFNEMLNTLVQSSKGKVKYRHTKEIDQFFAVKGRRDKIRVSRHENTGQIVKNGIIRKRKLQHLNVYVPTAPLDYRITVALEEQVSFPVGLEPDITERHKDRLSYQHQLVQVDLTQVSSVSRGSTTSVNQLFHEIEVEFVNTARDILLEKRRMDSRSPSKMLEHIIHLVDNIRFLAGQAIKGESNSKSNDKISKKSLDTM
jgi:hypothetical protein